MNQVDDDLDDLTLPQRPRRPEPRAVARPSSREDLADEMVEQDREFTLGTGTVLALFFGLALICAVFFGFGYSMGRKSAAAAPETSAAATGDSSPSTADAAANKPAAGSPAIQAIPGYLSQSEADAANRNANAQPYKAVTGAAAKAEATSVTVPVETAAVPKAKKPADDPDARIVETPRPLPPALPAPRPVAVPTPAATAPVQTMNAGNAVAGGPVYVQIAAVSHKEDADVLLSALKRRGYSVFTRTAETDKLIHVQVGPFAGKKDAEAMRQRLLGDGYNAILK